MCLSFTGEFIVKPKAATASILHKIDQRSTLFSNSMRYKKEEKNINDNYSTEKKKNLFMKIIKKPVKMTLLSFQLSVVR